MRKGEKKGRKGETRKRFKKRIGGKEEETVKIEEKSREEDKRGKRENDKEGKNKRGAKTEEGESCWRNHRYIEHSLSLYFYWSYSDYYF